MATSIELDQGTQRQRALDNKHRLARYLNHAAKTGISPGDSRDVLLALRVQAAHPHAAPIQLRLPYQRNTETVYIDTSGLPADHGRMDRAPVDHLALAAPALLSELQAADRLLVLALNCMTDTQQFTFAEKSERLGLSICGATRYHERAAVIARATGGVP